LGFFPLGNHTVLAGRDLEAGGTWLGINNHGIIVAVTNNRQLPFNDLTKRSRGELATEMLGSDDFDNTFEQIVQESGEFSNFNLLAVDAINDKIQYIGTRDSLHPNGESILEDAFAVSNGTIHSDWPKMKFGIQKIKTALAASKSDTSKLLEAIIAVLTDQRTYSENMLPTDTIVSPQGEVYLSSIFIKPGHISLAQPIANMADRGLFGTVSSSIILVREDGTAEFTEISWRDIDHINDDDLQGHFRKNKLQKCIKLC
jgi:uncharacterized protein with NRDE domain